MAGGVLVALDGSPFAARALPYAELLAQRCHVDLILAQAVRPVAREQESGAQARERALAEARNYLAHLPRSGSADTSPAAAVVEEGAAASVLLDIARSRAVSFIVLATHGRSGPSRWVMGSVAEQVLRETHLPVLLLTPAALDAGGPARLGQRLLVPVDGSELSQRIFPVVKDLAHRLSLPLTLVQALETAWSYGAYVPYQYNVAVPVDVFESAKAAVAASLRDIAKLWREEELDVDSAVESGMVAEVIADVAVKREAGWIAMASHGHGGLGGLVLGSTALRVLHHCTLPVLLAVLPSSDRDHLGRAE